MSKNKPKVAKNSYTVPTELCSHFTKKKPCESMLAWLLDWRPQEAHPLLVTLIEMYDFYNYIYYIIYKIIQSENSVVSSFEDL